MAKKVIIIGGGPGGYVAAIRLSRLGFETTLIEKERIGGVCLNHGCIPTKALYRSAQVFRTAKELDQFGLELQGEVKPQGEKIRQRKNDVVDTLVGGIEQLLKSSGVQVILGEAHIEGPGMVRVNGETLSYDKLIVATGSTSFVPPIPGIDSPGVVTSTELLDADTLPEHLVIIGGGIIGMEFAGIFAAFGCKVTVLEALPNILAGMDSELVKRMKPMLKKQGIEVHTAMAVEEITTQEGVLTVKAQGKKDSLQLTCDRVLVATGRKARVTGFGLENLPVEIQRKGIVVDEYFRTTAENVYAIGDVNGLWQLAHVASAQGEYVADLLAGEKPHLGKMVPGCVFLFPEMSSVGWTEDRLKEEGIPYKSSKFMFGANGKAQTLGEPEGLIKVLADEDNRLLGVHILGPHASDLIAEATLACEKGMRVEDLKPVIHAHPTLSESFYESVMGLTGDAVHMIQTRR